MLQGVVAALDLSNAVAVAAMSAQAQPGDAAAAAGAPAVLPSRRSLLLAGAPPRRALLQAPRRLHQARARVPAYAFLCDCVLAWPRHQLVRVSRTSQNDYCLEICHLLRDSGVWVA